MKRVLLLPCVVSISVLTLVLFSITNTRPAHPATVAPNIPDVAKPSHLIIPEGVCPKYVPDYYGDYCHFAGNIWVSVVGNKISQTDLYFTDYNLSVGDLILEWGTPIAAAYDSDGAHSLYWPDRYVYVLTADRYGPFSKVGFITYGIQPYSFNTSWHGFGGKPGSAPMK